MRTRLDEIVEEEAKKWNGSPLATVPWKEIMDKIAERAFRHGVEMDRGYSWIGEPASAVQPAPAEEKMPKCPRCGMTGQHNMSRDGTDRRKGERRKVDPVVLTKKNCPGVKLFTRRDGYVRIDRRTGTNRRSRG